MLVGIYDAVAIELGFDKETIIEYDQIHPIDLKQVYSIHRKELIHDLIIFSRRNKIQKLIKNKKNI
jgi:hypothetical protein